MYINNILIKEEYIKDIIQMFKLRNPYPGVDSVNISDFVYDYNNNLDLLLKINTSDYEFDKFKSIVVDGGRLVYVPTIKDRIAMYYIKDLLTTRYKIKFPYRQNIITDIKTNVLYNENLLILKLDIKNFFNSISHRQLIDKIENNRAVPSNIKLLIKTFLTNEFVDESGVSATLDKGVFPGTPISSALSEIYMETVDKKIKQSLTNLTYYSRYVDDIIIMIDKVNSKKEIIEQIQKIFLLINQYDLEINETKTQIFTIETSNRKTKKIRFMDFKKGYVKKRESNIKRELNKYVYHKHHNNITNVSKHNIDCLKLNYLGYEFICKKDSSQNLEVTISITDKKKRKMKKKIHIVFEEYHNNFKAGNKQAYYILREQLRFLLQVHVLPDRYGKKYKYQHIGNFINYKHVTDYTKLKDLSSYARYKLDYYKNLTSITVKRLNELNEIINKPYIATKITKHNLSQIRNKTNILFSTTSRSHLLTKSRRQLIATYLTKVKVRWDSK